VDGRWEGRVGRKGVRGVCKVGGRAGGGREEKEEKDGLRAYPLKLLPLCRSTSIFFSDG
jgi:hypothetical protein